MAEAIYSLCLLLMVGVDANSGLVPVTSTAAPTDETLGFSAVLWLTLLATCATALIKMKLTTTTTMDTGRREAKYKDDDSDSDVEDRFPEILTQHEHQQKYPQKYHTFYYSFKSGKRLHRDKDCHHIVGKAIATVRVPFKHLLCCESCGNK